MIATLLASLVGIAEPPGSADFAESRLEIAGDAFDYEIFDLDGDGRLDLIVTTVEAGRRELLVHRQRANGAYPDDPDWKLPVPPDVTAYVLMDVREEPGFEVLLTTRSGVFSASPTKASLRGNLRREFSLPMFPTLPKDGPLRMWPFVMDLDGDGQSELFTIHDHLWTALGMVPSEDGSGRQSFGIRLRLLAERLEREASKNSITFGRGMSISSSSASQFFPGARSSAARFGESSWLMHYEGWQPPTLFDWDLDGRLDLIDRADGNLRIRRQNKDQTFAENAIKITIPESLGDAEDWTKKFRDLDDDGRFELAMEKEIDDEAHVFTVVPVDATGRGGEPTARVKLQTMAAEFDLVDVDRDGYLDLAVRTVDIPGGIQRLTNVRLDVSYQVYRGAQGSTLSRRPVLRIDRRYRPEDLGRIQESLIFDVAGDFDGDGLGDLLTVQTSGTLDIIPLERDGDDFALADEPLTTYQPSSPILRARPLDLSPDGVSDLLLRHGHSITVFVSRKGGRP